MPAREHLNKQLFHGSSTLHGVLGEGDLILPAGKLGVMSNYPEYMEDLKTHAFATSSLPTALEFAKTAADGWTDNPDAKPVVYEVHNSADAVIDPNMGNMKRTTNVKSPTGFRVKKRIY